MHRKGRKKLKTNQNKKPTDTHNLDNSDNSQLVNEKMKKMTTNDNPNSFLNSNIHLYNEKEKANSQRKESLPFSPTVLVHNKRLSNEVLQGKEMSLRKSYPEDISVESMNVEESSDNRSVKNNKRLSDEKKQTLKENDDDINLDLNVNIVNNGNKVSGSDKTIISPPTPSKKRKVNVDAPSPLTERYINVTCVRKGDSGCIYYVQDKVSNQDLCVKEVTPFQAKKEYDFAKELNDLSNPNIMVYSFVAPNILESIWCQGGSYDHYAQRAESPPIPLHMLSFFRDLSSGVAHIETRGFVHLDLKPANILVSPVSSVPTLLICDFGSMVHVGTAIDDDQEGDGKYIAPEVFSANYKASTKFDIYSLALCIIEISTGVQMSNEKWNSFKQGKIDIKKLENLSDDVYALIPKMLSLEPEMRPDASSILPFLQSKLKGFV